MNGEKSDRMAFQARADLQIQAIGWLPKGCGSLGGGTVVRFPRIWMSSGECRVNHPIVTTSPNFGRSFFSAVLVALTLLLTPAAATHAQPATQVELELVLSGLSSTVDLRNAGDDRLFAVGQGGIVEIVSFDAQGNATLLPTPFLDISLLVRSGGEQGLLGLAFHPEYDTNGFLFVNYTCDASAQADCASDGDTIIARYTVSGDPDVADPSSALVVATIPQDAANHNGGQLQFEPFPAPGDGRTILYIGMGDGGGGNDPGQNAQNLNTLLGKMLRVDVDNLDSSDPLPRYHIPADNPLLEAIVNEIWAYGLRNPWRFSFDRLTGDLFIADVGQGEREEIDFQAQASKGGENYGWRQCEGTRVNFPDEAPAEGCTGGGGLTPPVLEYTHAEGCSVTGGYIYRGVEFGSELDGTYFYADFCTGQLWGARPDGGAVWANTIDEDTGLTFNISTFGESDDGELYLATLSGNLYRIRPVQKFLDTDGDGVVDGADNCPLTANANQTDTDGDGIGDACDADDDNDGVADGIDNCPFIANPGQTNTDGDAQGNACDPDDDNDGMPDSYELDNGFDPLNAADASQDADGDGFSNLKEFKAGTDPHDPDSIPKPINPMPWLKLLLLDN